MSSEDATWPLNCQPLSSDAIGASLRPRRIGLPSFATPVNWKQGQDVIVVPAVSDEDAKKTYPAGWKSPKPYIRIVQQPK